MNYHDGIQHMKELVSKLAGNQNSSFNIGNLTITYPGYKRAGDYKLTVKGIAPKHTDIVREIYNVANNQNIEKMIAFLDDVYTNGLNATSTIFPKAFIEKIYWITLQEEINYPQPMYKGRKLPFQRFYEGALAKVITKIDIEHIEKRTNNHKSRVPPLLATENYSIPSFYN